MEGIMHNDIKWIYSNERDQWKMKQVKKQASGKLLLELNGTEYQRMNGFGGCFNELGYRALLHLDDADRHMVMSDLFEDKGGGCCFTHCRMPIGGNDYSEDWYSLCETDGDYGMETFSLARDEKYLIPYIDMAKSWNKKLKLFASPWSPPTWMKSPKVYNWGKLIKTPQNLAAYALYFARFVDEYSKRGIKVGQIHIQNEPVANQKFPSCMWTGEELRDFIRDYIGPEFKRRGLDTEIWLGTINAPGCDYKRLIFDKWATEDYDYFANTVLIDEDALQYITGVSYQWGGKIAIQRTFESWWPRIRLMQSENECGFGDNTWEYARYNFTMMKHYISNGAESYMYWNLMLEPHGVSTWGDPQNAMITIDPKARKAIYNPDYFVMKHFSSFVRDGAVRLGTKGPMSGDIVAFRNPDGSIVLIVLNPFNREIEFSFKYKDEIITFDLEPLSINSMVL
jgi:glucosylceramidase